MWTTRYEIRPPDDVLQEIIHYQQRYGITGVQFYDLTAIIKTDWTVEFCTKLLVRGIGIDPLAVPGNGYLRRIRLPSVIATQAERLRLRARGSMGIFRSRPDLFA